jgi:conjugal transfer/entry exclusion protein
MTRTRRILLGTTAGIALLVAGYSTPARAEIPVIDTAALGEWITSLANDAKAYALQLQQYLTQVKQYVGEELSWVTQASQYATQLQQYANELQMFINFVHYPSLGTAMALLSSAGLGNSLPINPYAVLALVNGLEYGQGGLPEISGILGSLSGLVGRSYATAHVYTPTDGSWASQEIIARANGIAGEQGAAQATYTDLRTHQAGLQALRDHLATASSPKDVQDTQAQIELETTWTTNEAAQLSAISATYAAQSDSMAQRDNEKLDMDIETFVQSSPTPVP